jgi:hypothetical protein
MSLPAVSHRRAAGVRGTNGAPLTLQVQVRRPVFFRPACPVFFREAISRQDMEIALPRTLAMISWFDFNNTLV